MNYYPYVNMVGIPYMSAPVKTGFFTNLFKGINFSSILNGTGKVLNIANQAIPLIKQAKPVINNAKTMFQVMNEFRKIDTVNNVSNDIKNDTVSTVNNTQPANIVNQNNSLPTFFQ